MIPAKAVDAARMPHWMAKYPCPSCGAGYGQCREGALANLQCCKDCQHPGYRLAQPNPWTADELEEMWTGRELPTYIARAIQELRSRDRSAHGDD